MNLYKTEAGSKNPFWNILRLCFTNLDFSPYLYKLFGLYFFDSVYSVNKNKMIIYELERLP